jgi:hypothetical protein
MIQDFASTAPGRNIQVELLNIPAFSGVAAH